MPYGAEYWAPQPQAEDPRQRPPMRIPRIEDYWTPQDAKMAADAELRRRLAARGPVATIGSHNRGTVIDLGAAAGIISDIIAAKKAEKMGATVPAQARYESELRAHQMEAADQRAQEMAEDRRIDNERMAAYNRSLMEDRAADNVRQAERDRVLADMQRGAAEDRRLAREQMDAYRREMLGFRKSELGMSGGRLNEERRHNLATENAAKERETRLANPPDKEDPIEKEWRRQAMSPGSPGGIAISENEKDALRQVREKSAAANKKKPDPLGIR